MAILFDWYENPDSYDKSPEDKIPSPPKWEQVYR